MVKSSTLPVLPFKMTDTINGAAAPEEDELVDYEEDQPEEANQAKGTENLAKKGYVGIHSTGFKDFLLKPELLRAIVDCGFEHPSEGGCNQEEYLFLAFTAPLLSACR